MVVINRLKIIGTRNEIEPAVFSIPLLKVCAHTFYSSYYKEFFFRLETEYICIHF